MYSVTGMGADSMKRAYIESTRRGAFGTTSVRIQSMPKPQEAEQPGPSHYQPKEKNAQFQTKYQQHTSNFQSMSNRFNDLTNGAKVRDTKHSKSAMNLLFHISCYLLGIVLIICKS